MAILRRARENLNRECFSQLQQSFSYFEQFDALLAQASRAVLAIATDVGYRERGAVAYFHVEVGSLVVNYLHARFVAKNA